MNKAGFSLVELMIALVVIAIMALIAVPNIAHMTSHAHFAKNERNAQNVALLAAAIRSAGGTNEWSSIDDIVDALEQTVVVTSWGQTHEFSISPLTADDRLAIAEYLVFTNGMVIYQAGE